MTNDEVQTLRRATTPKKRVAFVRFPFRANRVAFRVNRAAFRANRVAFRVNRAAFRVSSKAFRANRVASVRKACEKRATFV